MMENKDVTLQRIANNYETFKKDYKNNELIDVGLACGVANSVGYLLEEIKHLKHDLEAVKGVHLFELLKRLDSYQQALKFYANESNYKQSSEEYFEGYPPEVMNDRGWKAKKVLEG